MTMGLGRFLLTGGAAALINVVSRYLLNAFMPFELAVAFAYGIGMLAAYGLARAFVFGASGRPIASELGRFALVNVVSLALVWCISVGLARLVFPAISFTWHADEIAHVVGVATPAITSYFGHRSYTFARHGS
jgi:putative flippase GtrA